ncbi:uncharacterized protein LOC135938810 [Cloeon dipterum]|uniref:uncharacterized protein LOC135938810 n=1 Tax=Cloeon dipterum TaxID=197152 RepID=UPI0032200FBE
MSFDFFEAEEMKKYRKENGPFRKLSDLLKVPAISEEKIETFCSLVAEKIREKNNSFRGVISPYFPDLKEELSNVVGVMVSADCSISWAEITKDYRLDNWGQVPMFSGQKKLAPHEIHEAVCSAVKEIPQSRVYVFESIPNLSPQQSYIQPYIERKETHAMLLALLNAREPVGNKVFYLRSKLPTRLFKIMVGNERISSRPLVTRLLQGECVGENDPCRLTDLNPETFDAFSKLPGVQQEAYSNALILAMSFLKLLPIEMSDRRSGDE